jgi:hypothetical protein
VFTRRRVLAWASMSNSDDPTPSASVSRRTALTSLGAGGIGLALAASARQASAQDATLAAMAGHPIVATWLLTFPADPGSGPGLNSYTADGITFQTDPARGDAQGAWEPKGERTAVMNLVFLALDGNPVQGKARVRATLEVDATGDAFAGVFTVGGIAAGTPQGESGPAPVEGRRVRAELLSTT